MADWEWIDTADSEWADTADSQWLEEETVIKVLAGTIATISSVSGANVKRAKDFTALFAAAATLAGAPPLRHKPVDGSFAASASLTSQINRLKRLVGSFAASANVSGVYELIGTSWEWLDTADSEWADTADSEWLDEFITTKILAGSLAATASFVASPLRRNKWYIAYISNESTFSGTVSRNRPIQGQIDVQSGLIGAIAGVTAVVLAGVIAASSVISGQVIKRTRYITGSLASQTTFVGGVIQRVRELIGTFDAISTFSGIIRRSRILQGSLAATSNVLGLIAQVAQKILTGAFAVGTSLSGTMQRSRVLQGTVINSSTIIGTINRLKRFIGYFTTPSTFTADLIRLRGFQGSISAISSVLEGGSDILTGVITAVGNLSATLSIDPRWVNSIITGVDVVTGKLVHIIGKYKITKEN